MLEITSIKTIEPIGDLKTFSYISEKSEEKENTRVNYISNKINIAIIQGDSELSVNIVTGLRATLNITFISSKIPTPSHQFVF